MSALALLEKIGVKIAEAVFDRLVNGKSVSKMSLEDFLEEDDILALRRAAALEKARRAVEARKKGR